MTPSADLSISTKRAAEDAVNATADYSIPSTPLGFAKPVRIIAIGAGASGITLVDTLRKNLPGSFELTVYEKNAGVGGTWFENRYPGCRCDVPSMNYQYSWKNKVDWTNICADAPEIREYLESAAEDMQDVIKLNHKIVSAEWNEDTAMWDVTVEHEGTRFTDPANFLIDASGILNRLRLPDIPHLENYKGTVVHTANWPEELSVENKKVVVIGNGASGVQVLPWVAKNCGELVHIIRTPTWILPPRVAMMRMGALAPLLSKIEIDEDNNFTPAQLDKFRQDPDFYHQFSDALDRDSNAKFAISLVERSPYERMAAMHCTAYMKSILKSRPDLVEMLMPDFPVSCKRLTPAPGYLESLIQPNAQVRKGTIIEATETGLVMDGGERIDADIIVCATGFDNTFKPAFPIIGRKGNLQDIWSKEIPKSYMSVGVEGMPNFFKFLGPNAPIAHGSVFTLSEHIAAYISRAISKAQTENIRIMTPNPQAVADYHEHVNAFMPRTAWAGACNSWYKHQNTPKGAIIGLHPGSRQHFLRMLEGFRGEDWDMEWDGIAAGKTKNRFGYLGNGFTVEEVALLQRMATTTQEGQLALSKAKAAVTVARSDKKEGDEEKKE